MALGCQTSVPVASNSLLRDAKLKMANDFSES